MARLRHVLRRDLDVVIDIWTDAFADDPYLRWIVPDDAGWPSFAHDWMRFVVELTSARGHTYLTDRDEAAVAWIPPDVAFAGPDDIARGHAILVRHAGEDRADSALRTILAARGHAIEEAHWTLQYVGVRSGHQGRGLGAAIVAPMLAVCDDEHLPCGLVSTNLRNVPFYLRAGFTVTAEVRAPTGDAVLRPMARAAGGSATP